MIKQHDPLIIAHKDIEIHEASNGYYIYHNPSGACRGMGDGVDMIFVNAEAAHPGTKEFARLLDNGLEEAYDEYMEAYFPDIAYD